MPVSLRLPENLNQRLSSLAAQTGRSKTFYMLEAIKQHIDDLEDLYLAEKRLLDVRSGKTQTVLLEEVMKRYGLESHKVADKEPPFASKAPNAATQVALQEANEIIKRRRARQV